MSLLVKLNVDTSKISPPSRLSRANSNSEETSANFRQLLPLAVLIERIIEKAERPDTSSPTASYVANTGNGTTADDLSPSPTSSAPVNGNERDNSLPSPASDAPANNDVEQPASLDYVQQYDAITEYVGNLSSGTRLLICKDTSVQHMEGLEDAARDNNGFVFRMMKNSVNRDLSKAGFATLPDV